MLDIGREKMQHRADFYRGFGEDLPFEDNSFHYVSLITSLEYVNDPEKVLKEASRVAKDKIFIGIYNRYAVRCIQLKMKGLFSETIYNRAKFFSIWEIRKMLRNLLGDVPVAWKTTGPFPLFSRRIYVQNRTSPCDAALSLRGIRRNGGKTVSPVHDNPFGIAI